MPMNLTIPIHTHSDGTHSAAITEDVLGVITFAAVAMESGTPMSLVYKTADDTTEAVRLYPTALRPEDDGVALTGLVDAEVAVTNDGPIQGAPIESRSEVRSILVGRIITAAIDNHLIG